MKIGIHLCSFSQVRHFVHLDYLESRQNTVRHVGNFSRTFVVVREVEREIEEVYGLDELRERK